MLMNLKSGKKSIVMILSIALKRFKCSYADKILNYFNLTIQLHVTNADFKKL